MANESYAERIERQQRELELKLEQELINSKLKKQRIMKLVLGGLIGIVLSVFLFASCERINAGHVGVKVNQFGDNKCVCDVVLLKCVVL